MTTRLGDDDGSATVLAAFMVAALVIVTTGGVWIGSAVVARHRAQAAADLSALVAAQRIPAGPAAACLSAEALARAMGAVLVDCAADGLDAVLTVSVASAAPIGGPALAAARAGPGQGA